MARNNRTQFIRTYQMNVWWYLRMAWMRINHERDVVIGTVRELLNHPLSRPREYFNVYCQRKARR